MIESRHRRNETLWSRAARVTVAGILAALATSQALASPGATSDRAALQPPIAATTAGSHTPAAEYGAATRPEGASNGNRANRGNGGPPAEDPCSDDPSSCDAPQSTILSGYITLPDDVRLRYTVLLPEGAGPFPVALVYDGYSEGSDPVAVGNDYEAAPRLLEAGYAVLGVSMRGTGCSGGSLDLLSRQWAEDGAVAVEWAASQPWSNGHVGMFGLSFPGLTQLAVASLRPPHLDAIAPFQVTADFYRDVMFPGGIFNSGFMGFWGLGNQPASSWAATGYDIGMHPTDTRCEESIAQQYPGNVSTNIFVEGLRRPYFDESWRDANPSTYVDQIDVPMFTCLTWQDDEVGSRNGIEYLDDLFPRPGRGRRAGQGTRTVPLWVIASNGYHGMCEFNGRSPAFATDERAASINTTLVRFFDRFVKHEDNGFESDTPHVQIWHEAHSTEGPDAPSWVTTFDTWPIPVAPVALSLHAGGVLDTTPPGADEAGDSYAYPAPSASMVSGTLFGQDVPAWKVPVPPGGSRSFTTPALTDDVEFLGPASADIWLSSTASDTDLQVTLTEVRPDGQEQYIARGWLRMSHRALDPARSTPLRPFQTHTRQDSAPLVPGVPALARVEIFPFDHVFRAGSSIRLTVEAPTGETGGWSFDYLKTPATNTILHDAQHPSRLVLGLLDSGRPHPALPPCDTILNQPCRADTGSVPPGKLSLP